MCTHDFICHSKFFSIWKLFYLNFLGGGGVIFPGIILIFSVISRDHVILIQHAVKAQHFLNFAFKKHMHVVFYGVYIKKIPVSICTTNFQIKLFQGENAYENGLICSLEGTSKGHLVQALCSEQGHIQPVPVFHHPHNEKVFSLYLM